MAKRLKLSQTDGGKHLTPKMPEAVKSIFQLQDLVTIPETKRLQQLDNDMHEIIKNKRLSVEDKVRQFEGKLAEYRRVQDKIVKNGSTRWVDDGDWKEDVKSYIRKALEEVIGQQISRMSQPTTRTSPVEEVDLEVVQPESSQDESKVDLSSKAVLDVDKKPLSIKAADEPESTKAPQPKPSGTKQIVRSQVESALESAGIKVEDGRYTFTIRDQDDKAKQRKSTATFAKATYDKAMSYLLSETPSEMPFQTERLIGFMYSAMEKNLTNMGELFKKFPNLKTVKSKHLSLNMDGWSRL